MPGVDKVSLQLFECHSPSNYTTVIYNHDVHAIINFYCIQLEILIYTLLLNIAHAETKIPWLNYTGNNFVELMCCQ